MFNTGFGIEIEFTGITRAQAAQAAGYLGGRVESSGDYYNTQKIHTPDGRVWKLMSGGSIRTQKKAGSQVLSAIGEFSAELVSPILHYESDIETLQELIQVLRRADGFTNSSSYSSGRREPYAAQHSQLDQYHRQQERPFLCKGRNAGTAGTEMVWQRDVTKMIWDEIPKEQNTSTIDYSKYVVDQQIPHNLYENFTYKTPATFSLFGERIKATHWKDTLLLTCEVLAKKGFYKI